MTQPLALVLYEKLLPGSQLVNRLQDLKYKVQTLPDASLLVEVALQAGPLVLFADLESTKTNVCNAIERLKKEPRTSHLPVIAFGADSKPELQAAGRAAGATLVVSDTALLTHLPQFLEQALQVE